jgi:hypothetical protein
MSPYATIITEQLNKLKRAEVDPSHVEAYMRCQYGTLDHLDRKTFNREVKIAVGCIDQTGTAEAESLAMSYGLKPRRTT